MMKQITWIFSVCLLLSCAGRNDRGIGVGSSFGKWNIPFEEVKDGGPGKDGIPALLNPEVIDVDGATYLDDDDLVLGIIVDDQAYAYSHKILDYHEIINADFSSMALAVTYCPLTGTGIAWERESSTNTFGVSGLLYNSNLIPYDRETNSNWSQIRLDCVNGKRLGDAAKTIPMVETTFAAWKAMYPTSKVVSTNTGYSRNYNRYPYGSYLLRDDLIFPVSNLDTRLFSKERVHAIIVNDHAKVYRFEHFNNEVQIIEDEINGQAVVLIGSEEKGFIVSFNYEKTGNSVPAFTVIDATSQKNYPSDAVFKDVSGQNAYNLFGEVVMGPQQGTKLTPTLSMMGYWFAWGAFYPSVEIYGE